MSACLSCLFALVLAQADNRTPFEFKEGNYKLSFPSPWRVTKSPSDIFQLALKRGLFGSEYVFVSALETPATVEDLLDTLEEDLKLQEFFKEQDRREIKVAGTRATRLEFEIRPTGIKATLLTTVFTHQGIAYRIQGVSAVNDVKRFEAEYKSILDSFEFLGERKEWVEKFQGKPAPNALLGGLATFELNRPRWREITFERPREFLGLENVAYQFFPGGAWAHVRIREARGDAAAELEDLRDTLSARLQKVVTTERMDKGPRSDIPTLEITGQVEPFSYLFRATALVEDGLAAHIWMEAVASQREVTRADWEQLLRTFRLLARSKPAQPPAYPILREPEQARPDPGLAAFLGRARRVAEGSNLYRAISFSPDGNRMLMRSSGGAVIRHLTSNRLERIPPDMSDGSPIAWSRDGRQVAFDLGDEVAVGSLDSKETRKIAGDAGQAVFTPGGDQLLVCMSEPGQQFRPARFHTSRLEAITLADGARQTLIDFPLCQVSHPAVSPDGKQIALVTNRDYPRSEFLGGHLYVAAIDGSGLRQLTHDPEEIRSVSWSPDGTRLYVVRRLAVGERGRVGTGGEFDLYRVSAKTGEAVNLTRSGHIGRVWASGPDLILEVHAPGASPAQRGIFRISAEELEKATASRPVPPVFDAAVLRKHLAEAVQKAIGKPSIRDVVPSVELLEKVAKVFAETATTRCGCPLDFSRPSLERASGFLLNLEQGRNAEADPVLRLGFGAYLGETLRRSANAEWKIKPVPFGEWRSGRFPPGNPLVEVVFPFSQSSRGALGLDDDLDRDDDGIPSRSPRGGFPSTQGRKLILVYPPAHAEEALREASGPAYEKAMELVDRGELADAVSLLEAELVRQPKNRLLAREALALCEAARQPKRANELARKAVEAGSDVPELLLRHAEATTAGDLKKALVYYNQAVRGEGAPAEVFIKLGQAHATLGRPAIAESCWRRAYWMANRQEQKEIRKLMGLPETENDPASGLIPKR